MEIDWTKFPMLAPIFENRPRDTIYWQELRALLQELTTWCDCGAKMQFVARAPRGTDGLLCPLCDSELLRELSAWGVVKKL